MSLLGERTQGVRGGPIPYGMGYPLSVVSRFSVPSENLKLVNYAISGITKDSSGSVLGDCVVDLFITATDVKADSVVSDSVTGYYLFNLQGLTGTTYYVVAYKSGSPDVAGTTLNTLVSSEL